MTPSAEEIDTLRRALDQERASDAAIFPRAGERELFRRLVRNGWLLSEGPGRDETGRSDADVALHRLTAAGRKLAIEEQKAVEGTHRLLAVVQGATCGECGTAIPPAAQKYIAAHGYPTCPNCGRAGCPKCLPGGSGTPCPSCEES